MIAELIERHGFPTDKEGTHSYADFYDRELAPYRGRPIRLLEIGVYQGGSLRLWDAYFNQEALIVGVDIDLSRAETCAGWVADLIQGDAYTEAMAARLGDFDLVIDDGPHTLRSQLDAIRLYAPRLRPGGLLVIEDVQHPDWLGRLSTAVPAGCGYRMLDLRGVKNRYDDMLFVVRKPE